MARPLALLSLALISKVSAIALPQASGSAPAPEPSSPAASSPTATTSWILSTTSCSPSGSTSICSTTLCSSSSTTSACSICTSSSICTTATCTNSASGSTTLTSCATVNTLSSSSAPSTSPSTPASIPASNAASSKPASIPASNAASSKPASNPAPSQPESSIPGLSTFGSKEEASQPVPSNSASNPAPSNSASNPAPSQPGSSIQISSIPDSGKVATRPAGSSNTASNTASNPAPSQPGSAIPASSTPGSKAAPSGAPSSNAAPSTPAPSASASSPPTTITTQTSGASSSAAAPYCYNYAVPQDCSAGVDYCSCSDGNAYSHVTGGNPCPWTTAPPSSMLYTTPSCQTTTTTPITVPTACASGVVPNDGSAFCWDDLDLTDYVNSWWSNNSNNCDNTVAHSPEPGDPATSFANCWYKIVTPQLNPVECDIIGTGSACKEPSWSDFTSKDELIMIQQFWVTWSIYNVNQWFISLNSAINDAGSQVEGITGKVVTAFNPPEVPSTPSWEYLLDALGFALSLYAEGSLVTKAALRSLPQSATLLGKVFPDGQVEGTVTQWSDVEGQVSTFIKNWADGIGNAIELVVNDEPSFVSFASAGLFTGGVTDLSGLTDSIYSVLGTYLVSATANATGYVITRTAGQSIQQVQASGGLQWNTGCTSYDSIGVCGPFYYDGTDTYSLVNTQKMQDDETSLMAQVFEPNGGQAIADINMFFTGSLLCSQVAGNPNGGGQPTQSSDLSTVNCIANNRVCTWSYGSDPLGKGSDYFNDGCSDSDMPQAFVYQCNAATFYGVNNGALCAPFAYFGPYITTDNSDNDLPLCNTHCFGGNVS